MHYITLLPPNKGHHLSTKDTFDVPTVSLIKRFRYYFSLPTSAVRMNVNM
jgi:hypothetical protein